MLSYIRLRLLNSLNPFSRTVDTRMRARLTAEFVGTFFLVLICSLSTQQYQNNGNTGVPPPVVASFAVMTLIASLGHVSQAHLNPAVSLGLCEMGFFERGDVIPYIVTQVAGATCGASVAWIVAPIPKPNLTTTPSSPSSTMAATATSTSTTSLAPSLAAATILSFPLPAPMAASDALSDLGRAFFAELLMSCFLNIANLMMGFSQKPNGFFLFIGFAVLIAGSSVGTISGAAMNPAVASGMSIVRCAAGNCDALAQLWLYWIAPPLGMLLANVLYRIMMQQPVIPNLVSLNNSRGGSTNHTPAAAILQQQQQQQNLQRENNEGNNTNSAGSSTSSHNQMITPAQAGVQMMEKTSMPATMNPLGDAFVGGGSTTSLPAAGGAISIRTSVLSAAVNNNTLSPVLGSQQPQQHGTTNFVLTPQMFGENFTPFALPPGQHQAAATALVNSSSRAPDDEMNVCGAECHFDPSTGGRPVVAGGGSGCGGGPSLSAAAATASGVVVSNSQQQQQQLFPSSSSQSNLMGH